jgi:glutamine synthetase
MCAEQFKVAADSIEGGMTPVAVTQKLLNEHWRVIFNGNGYSAEWPVEADKRGLFHFDSGVDAICQLTSEKNLALFAGNGVLSAEECEARKEVMLEGYFSAIEMECLAQIEMMEQNVIPDATAAGLNTQALVAGVGTLKAALASIHAMATTVEKAHACRTLRMETMVTVRTACDDAEANVPAALWSLSTYKDLTFMDMVPNALSK